MLTETEASTSPTAISTSSNINRLVTDQLGTPRIVFDQSGSLATTKRHDDAPFGEELLNGARPTTGGYASGDANRQKFTEKERDNETGLDYFGARYYGNGQGRFNSSDELLNSGRPDSPQTWNRYSYTQNNPLNRTDPTGLYDLNNTCGAKDKKCNETFKQHADQLKKGLDNLQKNLGDVKDPVQKSRLEKSLKALGSPGDHNGVTVTFGANRTAHREILLYIGMRKQTRQRSISHSIRPRWKTPLHMQSTQLMRGLILLTCRTLVMPMRQQL